MDFEQYVVARRVPLLRASVLLGVPPADAAGLVDRVLIECADRVERHADPDPEVYAGLVAALPEARATTPAGDDPGLDVRRGLDALDPDARVVAVLAFHADLAPHETGDALALAPAEVTTLERAARRALGAVDGLHARALLMCAADSVRVPPLPPLSRPPAHRRWPVLLGTATTVAAVVLASAALARTGPTDPATDALGEDQMPSLFGYRIAWATQLLERRGWTVEQVMAPACDPVDMVVGTVPPTGAHVPVGDTVTVLTAFPSGYDCPTRYVHRSDAWDFLSFAAGRGPAPSFAERVAVAVDGSEPVVLPGSEAVGRERWGQPSVLTALADALAEVYDVPGSPYYLTPHLSAAPRRPPARTCGVPRPPGLQRRSALSLTLTAPTSTYECPLTVDLYRTADRSGGAIDAVVLYTARTPGS